MATMACTMLDALRHRIVQNIELLHVAAAPPLTIDLHAPAQHCIPAEQCQKNIDRKQKSSTQTSTSATLLILH